MFTIIKKYVAYMAIASVLAIGLSACGDSGSRGGIVANVPAVPAGDNVVAQWNATNVDAIINGTLGPPMAARSLAIVSTAMFDAWAAYDPIANGTRFGADLRRPAGERNAGNQSKAISFAAYITLIDLFPAQKARFDTLMETMNYKTPGVAISVSTDRNTPEGIGQLVAQALISYRSTDGSNQSGNLSLNADGIPQPYQDYATSANPRYVSPHINGAFDPTVSASISLAPNEKFWHPLTIGGVTQTYLGAYWGRVTPFALTVGSQLRPAAPSPYNGATHLAQLDAVIAKTATLTTKEKVIAEYWADGPRSETPPGHWHEFAKVVSTRDKNTLDDDAKMYFALSNAVFDAGIATWEAKRFYTASRPITQVRNLKRGTSILGLNGATIAGEDWQPFQIAGSLTPPFPEYTSGHSAFSAAGAEVLKKFTRSDAFVFATTITGVLKAEPTGPSVNVTLSYTTFTEAADEAGISRIYGGIHIQEGDLAGRTIGRSVGALVFEKARTYWDGLPSTR